MMASSAEFAKVPGMTKEMRAAIVAAFDALSDWRQSIESVNERHLGKVLDQMSAVALQMGWPEDAVKLTRENLDHVSQAQTEMIDQLMDGWKQQLASSNAPMAMPPFFTGGSMPEFNPWTFWMQAAEVWQRTWMPDRSPRRNRSH
jgi:hypothetical protein